MATDDPRALEGSGTTGVHVDAVSYWYEARGSSVHTLDDVDLAFAPGAFVTVVGPSGCGKTTLLQLLAGFRRPTAGRIIVDGAEVTRPSYQRGVVFQRPELYPWLTVRGNVEFGPRMRHVPRKERRLLAVSYLDLVGLTDFGGARPYELSGGMQQRCQIARVLANDPEIILMDEPFGALDALTRERMQSELRQIWRRTGKTVIFITHSVEEAAFLSTRVVVMSPRPGRVLLDVDAPFGRDERPLDALRGEETFLDFQARVRSAITQPVA